MRFKKSIVAGLVLLGFVNTTLADLHQDGLIAFGNHDYATAIKLLTPVAKQGHALAQNILGIIYQGGLGTPKDDIQALYWYRKAAEQGDSSAQNNLGAMYANGRGVPQNDAQAVQWYRKAAEQGFAAAQTFLGVMYAKGQGVPQDYVRAHLWFNLAAATGYEIALKGRDMAANEMTNAQIAEAQKLARECLQRQYKNCD